MVEAERVSDFVAARKERNMASARRELDVGVSGFPFRVRLAITEVRLT